MVRGGAQLSVQPAGPVLRRPLGKRWEAAAATTRVHVPAWKRGASCSKLIQRLQVGRAKRLWWALAALKMVMICYGKVSKVLTNTLDLLISYVGVSAPTFFPYHEALTQMYSFSNSN